MILAIESIYLPEMATGTVMWNIRGGLYVDVDLYASSAASGERGMDPQHNARRADYRGRSRARSRLRDWLLVSRFVVLIVTIIIIAEFARHVMDFRGRAKTDRRRDATVRSSSGLWANKTHRRVVFTTEERESDYLRVPYRGNINGGPSVRDTLLRDFRRWIIAKSVSQSPVKLRLFSNISKRTLVFCYITITWLAHLYTHLYTRAIVNAFPLS